MLNLSSILVLAVIPILISGSSANPQQAMEAQPVTPDVDACMDFMEEDCSNGIVMTQCPNMCAASFCSDPWHLVGGVGGQCMQVINAEVHQDWSSARMYCSIQDPAATVEGRVRSDLAVHTDNTTFSAFITKYGQPNTKYWIGGSDLYREPQGTTPWLWINAVHIDYSAPTWPGECIYINNKEGGPVLGNDGCGSSLPFVCEKNKHK